MGGRRFPGVMPVGLGRDGEAAELLDHAPCCVRVCLDGNFTIHGQRTLAFPRVSRHIPDVSTSHTVTPADSSLSEAFPTAVVERELGRDGVDALSLAGVVG